MRKLIIKGKVVSAVRVSAGETAAEQYAASELAHYLELLTGVAADGDYPITLEIDASLNREGYRIDVSQTGLTIAGGSGRGVIYGVYGFLETYAGARFFMPGLETFGEDDIVVNEGCAYAPVFEFRQSDWLCGDDMEWSVKNHINNRTIPFRKQLPAHMGGGHKHGGWAHTLKELTGEDIPCLSDPENLRKAIAGVRRILETDPDVTIVSVSQNDGLDYCTCPACTAVAEEEGSQMGVLLRFVNAVADDIKDDYPDIIIDTLSYVYTRKPPKLTKPRENVCIRLCSFECCFSHPLNDASCPENRKFHDDIVEWNKLCSRIYIWDYVTNFVHYIPPFPNFGVLRENMRFFADHGVKGIYPEGNYNSPKSGEFGELRAYLLARLMWDPYLSSADYYRHMDEFLAAYYGPGWMYIRLFLDFTTMEGARNHAAIAKYPHEIIAMERYAAVEDTIDSWWDRAEALAGDRLEYVQRSRMQWRYIQCILHPDETARHQLLADVKKYDICWSECREEPEDFDPTMPPDRWILNYPNMPD